MISSIDPVDKLTVYENFISRCFVEDLPGEEWVDIPDFDGFYKVSNKLRIKSLVREINMANGATGIFYERVMKFSIKNDNDYHRIDLCKNGVRKQYLVHRIFAIVFIPNPHNYDYVNHIDGDKTNFSLSNLEWCTARQNQMHAYRTGLKKPGAHKKGENAHRAILNNEAVSDIKERLRRGELASNLSKEYSVSDACLAHIKSGKRWSHIK
jgi:hypothetical protein